MEERYYREDRIRGPEMTPLCERDQKSNEGEHEPRNGGHPIEAVGGLRIGFIKKQKVTQPVQAKLGVPPGVLSNETYCLGAEQAAAIDFRKACHLPIAVGTKQDIIDVDCLVPGFPKGSVHAGERSVVVASQDLCIRFGNLVRAPTDGIVALPQGHIRRST